VQSPARMKASTSSRRPRAALRRQPVPRLRLPRLRRRARRVCAGEAGRVLRWRPWTTSPTRASDLDCAFFRVYEDGKPIDSSKYYFKFDASWCGDRRAGVRLGSPGWHRTLCSRTTRWRLQRDFCRCRLIVKLLQQPLAAHEEAHGCGSNKQAAFAMRDQYFGTIEQPQGLLGPPESASSDKPR
jgi:hypothetical protein